MAGNDANLAVINALKDICNVFGAPPFVFHFEETVGLLSFFISPDVRHVDCKTLQSNINAESHYQ